MTLNGTVGASNTNHGPTLQFSHNGTNNRQFVIGSSGSGEKFDFGYSDSDLGNTTHNPHHGIAGYVGTTWMTARNTGRIGFGWEGDWGAYGANSEPLHPFHFIGSHQNGHTYLFRNNGGADGSGAIFVNTTGNHSWGIVTEFRIDGTGGDRPSILFSHGYNTNTWSVGFGYADDNFRINQNHGHRNGGWGTERFSITTSGTPYFNGSVAWYAGNDGSGSGLDADLLDGMNATSGVTGSTVVARDGNGYIYANHINFNTSETENPSISSFLTSNGDGWSRKSSKAHVRSQLGLVWGSSGKGTTNIAFASTANSDSGFYDVYNDGTPTGTWYSMVNMAHYGGNHGHQIAGSFYSAGDLYNRNNSNTTFSGWTKIWNAANDGSGSGLDADLLDGLDSTRLLRFVSTFGSGQDWDSLANTSYTMRADEPQNGMGGTGAPGNYPYGQVWSSKTVNHNFQLYAAHTASARLRDA